MPETATTQEPLTPDDMFAYLDDELHPVVTGCDRYEIYTRLDDCAGAWQNALDDHQTEVERFEVDVAAQKELAKRVQSEFAYYRDHSDPDETDRDFRDLAKAIEEL